MGRFNMDDYAPVEERIGLFYEAYPLGRIATEIVKLEPPLVVFKASVYRLADDAHPWATGFAYEKEGEGHVNQTSYIENCETSAVGRALANAGYHGRRDGAPRPSREEMQKVERMGGTPATPEQRMYSKPAEPVGVKHSNVPSDTPVQLYDLGLVQFGKHKGRSWAELVEKEPDYVEWAIEKMDKLPPAAKQVLAAALALHTVPAPPVDDRPLSEPAPDGLPF